MSWQHRGFTWKPRSSLTKRKRQWNWLVDFWSRVNEKCADLHKPFISYFFLVGVTVQLAESLSAAIPLGTSTKRANTKRVNHGRSRLFQDAVPSVSFWLRLFPVRGWRTRSLSLVSGLPTCWRCVRGWLMRLLWAYEHDFAAISPFLSERIGTLCRHPCSVLWLEQRTTGWHSGRSEGDSKSKHSHDSSHSLKSGDSIPRRSGWSGVDLGKLRWTCLLPTSPPTASCIFPWLRAPSARTHWHTAGLGPYASMRFPQWAYSHRHCASSGRTRSRSCWSRSFGTPGPGYPNSFPSRQHLPGSFLWGRTSSLRDSSPYGTCVQICGTSMCGSWTGRGRLERSTTASGRDHHSS